MDDSNPTTSFSNVKVRLTQALKFYSMKFKQMEEKKESLDEMLSFVTGIGMVPLKNLNDEDFELHVRLESILIETLREAYQKNLTNSMGLNTSNKRLLKKKLRKKQKQLQLKSKEQTFK